MPIWKHSKLVQMQNLDTQDESKYLDPVMLQYGMTPFP